MSRPITARKQKRGLPPTPHVKSGEPATRAETLALDLGRNLAGIARSNVAVRPRRMDCDSEAEFYALAQRYQAEYVFTIAGALTADFRHIEEAVVLSMLDDPALLRQQLPLDGYGMVVTVIREAEPVLTIELKKDEDARVAAVTALTGQGELFPLEGGAR